MTTPTASAVDLAAAVRGGEVGSRELLEAYLDRIARLDPPLRSVVTLDEHALDEADRADAELAHGVVRGPLHGLPITVKDAVETAGLRSTGGATELAEHVPDRDATAVARLKAAGAVVFGKTNVPPWSGDMQTYNELFGTTANPWDPALSPGGSSGGAAVAVACGFTAFELGTDIGGSIRIPSHLCGIYGIRPSWGLVPGDGYLAGPRPSRLGLDLNVLGPLARSAGDLDLLLGVLAGPPEPDAAAWRLGLPEPPGAELRGYRIGLWLDDPFCPVDSASAKVFGALADRLADAGARLDEALPGVGFEESYATYWTLLMAAGGLNAGPGITHAEWLAADEERQRQRAVWRAWFTDHDALLCPVLARTAYPHDHDGDYTTRMVPVNGTQRSHAEIARWTGLVGGLGLPCAVAPIGVDASGLPVGVQIITARWHDRTAIRLAGLIGELTGGFRVPPAVDSEREAR